MQEPTRFGNHLLLKKLGEDPLGGTYRAARIEGDALGQLVFLRIFSISAIDARALVASMREYNASASRLQAPGVTHAVDCGAVSGVAYAAYEYVTGWDLKELLRTASAAYSALERDHALLLAERIAKGLDVVHQADPSVQRPCHGFLLPQNVMVTSEGEIRLMGFESASFLATAMAQGQLSSDLKSYASPELRSGAPVGPPDDIYALGAILWELLTGVPPSLESAGMAAELASAKLTSGEPLPAGLGELLQSSLVAVRARTPRAGAWHKQLTDWMTRNEVRTTHFDLAFSVHELFRKRIQAEEQELEAEKGIDLRPKLAPAAAPPAEVPPGAAPGPPAAAATPSSAAVPALERTDVVVPPARKSGKGMLLGIAALVAVVAGVGWFVLSRRSDTPEAPVAAPPPVQTTPAEPAEPAHSEGLQLAQAELERLVRERAQAVGEQISAEYDEHIRSLQEQLREAQAAEEEARRLALETAAAERAGAEGATAEGGATTEGATTEGAAAGGATAESATAPSPPAPPAGPPAEPETASLPQDVPPAESETPPPAEENPPPAPAPPPAAPTTVPAASPPPAPPHQPVVIPPRLVRMADPVYPSRARQLRREATVLLKVLVDTDGTVLDAQPVVNKPDALGFVQSAVRAARGGTFRPATTDGVPTKMWTTVVITFKM